tara:strand:- start:327 stop:602 length:276 start_codon:yes stop_codon:yes gene_type:complete
MAQYNWRTRGAVSHIKKEKTNMNDTNRIEQIESQIVELHRQALATMNARYDEFDTIDDDYPDGPIGDPESLTNEAMVRAYRNVLTIIRGGQ